MEVINALVRNARRLRFGLHQDELVREVLTSPRCTHTRAIPRHRTSVEFNAPLEHFQSFQEPKTCTN